VMLSFTESLALITKDPQNVLVQQDENAILNCSTDSNTTQGRNTITWNYDNDIIVHHQCKPGVNTAFIVTSPDLQTDCNVIALAERVGGISGPYRCGDGSSDPQAVAMVIVLSKLTILLDGDFGDELMM